MNAIHYPILIVLCILGLNSVNLRTGKKSPTLYYYSVSVFVVHFAQITLNSIIFCREFYSSKLNDLKVVVITVIILVEIISGILALLINLTKCDEKMEVLQKLFEVEEYWSQINVRVMHSKRKHLKDMLVYFLMMFTQILTDYILFILFNIPAKKITLIIRYTSRVMAWTELYYFAHILLVSSKNTKRVNYELLKLKVCCPWSKNTIEIFKLRTLSSIHLTLRNVCKIQNSLYGSLILSLAVFAISEKLVIFYFLIVGNIDYFVHKTDPLIAVHYSYCVIWNFLFISASFFLLNRIGHLEEQLQNTVGHVLRLKFEVNRPDLNFFLRTFIRHIHDDKIQFTAYGFLSLDFTLMRKIWCTSTTLVLILLQFHFA